jgi:hypothetical protein
VAEGVHRRRLARAGQHQGAPAVALEVRRHRPGLAAGREGGLGRDGAQGAGHGPGEGHHLRAPHAEAVVGHGSGDGESRLGQVEPVHRLAGLAPAGELAGEPQRVARPGQEVGVQREDDVGLVEARMGVERQPEGDAGALGRLVLGEGRPVVEAGPGEARLQPPPQVGQQRRCRAR